MRIEKSRTMCDEMSKKVILIHYNKSEFFIGWKQRKRREERLS